MAMPVLQATIRQVIADALPRLPSVRQLEPVSKTKNVKLHYLFTQSKFFLWGPEAESQDLLIASGARFNRPAYKLGSERVRGNDNVLRNTQHPYFLSSSAPQYTYTTKRFLHQLSRAHLPACGRSRAIRTAIIMKPILPDASIGSWKPMTTRVAAYFSPQLHLVRWKSRKKQGPTQTEDSDSDMDDSLEADDFDAPATFKVMKIHSASMRTDAIISNALDVSRSQLEEIFYGSKLMLNGGKMLKKSVKMEEGDFVDVVMDRAEEKLKVKRVKVIKIYPERTNKDKLIVKVRVWKAPFFVNKPER